MKCWEIKIRLHGTIIIEDPHCPYGWRYSRCYDIDVPATQDVSVFVPSESEEEARIRAEKYCYEGAEGCELEKVTKVEFWGSRLAGECDDDYDELEFEFSDVDSAWLEED